MKSHTDEDKNVRCQNLRVPQQLNAAQESSRHVLETQGVEKHTDSLPCSNLPWAQGSGNEEFLKVCSVCAPFRIGPEHKFENWEILIATIMKSLETLFSLFPICCRFLKLDSLKPTPFRDSPGRLLAVKEMTRLGAG
jgi:hypothetical protein